MSSQSPQTLPCSSLIMDLLKSQDNYVQSIVLTKTIQQPKTPTTFMAYCSWIMPWAFSPPQQGPGPAPQPQLFYSYNDKKYDCTELGLSNQTVFDDLLYVKYNMHSQIIDKNNNKIIYDRKIKI